MEDVAESLRDKVILVTGGAKRIGRAIVRRLAEEGARVAVHYHTSEAAARELGFPVFRADLEKVSEIEAMFAEAERHFGRLDGLVNNAARFTRKRALEITEADWDYIHDVNLKAVFFCCQCAARLMQKTGGGRIVNMSSLGGLRPWADHVHYCASKAGVIMLTRALAKALAPSITVNSVAPGVIPMEYAEEGQLALIKATPAGRGGTPEEIAEAVLFFLKASNFVTGQVLAVDGGLSQR